jgi:hypothetical protein
MATAMREFFLARTEFFPVPCSARRMGGLMPASADEERVRPGLELRSGVLARRTRVDDRCQVAFESGKHEGNAVDKGFVRLRAVSAAGASSARATGETRSRWSTARSTRLHP